ncbi:ATP synthase F0 subunit B [Streptomyces sp. RB6PN25]|uniref:ATP synthase F0 subunit B n=1 Tax=Streptomyces humicola TaxID=2953240 RepID=A0ABT1Q2P5_9ACTN|nr:ATP synthase F0 subunit B [Streptomyces humicola]MCQ4084211.1 ATP synthase F0 subunit B [Streptomyces humicola]
MDVQKKLDEIVAAVEGARSMPMSASCVVNRAELLSLLGEVRSALPESLSHAEALLGDREQMLAGARAEAERIIASAHEQRGSLISDTEIARRSQAEADRILAEARREAEEIRAEADEYVDSKLANFEVVLTKTLGSVDRGRAKLLGRDSDADGYGDGYGEVDDEAPERSSDPAELRRRADAYVDTKLGAFEAVLAKTLEAVGRGRQKLTGHRPIDELGEHLAAQDGAAAGDQQSRQTDAEYLAELAGAGAGAGTGAGTGAQDEPAAALAYGEGDYGDYTQQPVYDPAAMAAATGYQHAGYEQGGYDQSSAYAYQNGGGYGGGYQDGVYQEGYPEYAQGQIPQQGGYADSSGYGWHQGYEGLPHAEGLGQIPQQHQPQQGLDETSFFDTSLIDLNHLRELDQGR